MNLPPLWKHQQRTIDLGLTSPRLFDTSDPGTGKTRAHLHLFDVRRQQNGGRALVVCPKTLMQSAWGADIHKYFPHLTVSYAYAPDASRLAAFEADTDVVIINTDGVKWLAKHAKLLTEFDTLIVDEISDYKHRESQRSKAIGKISKHFIYRAGLTGTPNPNSVTELWHQLMILDDGQHLGDSFFRFRSQVSDAVQIGPMKQHVKWVDKPNMEEVVGHIIKDISIRHQFDEVMDVPPNYTRTVSFFMPRKLMSAYLQLAKQAFLELEKGVVSPVNEAVMRQKLLQLISGAIYTDDHNYEVIDPARYDLITDLIHERDHSVVFFNWRHQREQLTLLSESKGIPYAVLDGDTPTAIRTEIVDAFQDGAYQALFLHPATGAHGLTLTRGRTTIWSSVTDRADWMKQGLHRVYRGGQTRKTETILVQAEDTIEPAIYERTLQKGVKMSSLLDLLRESSQC